MFFSDVSPYRTTSRITPSFLTGLSISLDSRTLSGLTERTRFVGCLLNSIIQSGIDLVKNTLCCCFWPTLVHFFACKCAYMWTFVTPLDSGSKLTAFYAVFALALYTRSGHCSPLWFPPGWAWLLWSLFAASFQWWRPGCCPAKATSPAKSVMDDVAADRSAGASSACN